MINVLNKHHTLTNFYHPNNHIIFPRNDYNYISKAKQEYNALIHNIERVFYEDDYEPLRHYHLKFYKYPHIQAIKQDWGYKHQFCKYSK